MKNYTATIMKGIAIISVVLGHCTTNNNIESFVNQYHLAVFFFVSVFFFKEKYLDATRNFFIKKLTRLYIPLLSLYFITFYTTYIYTQIQLIVSIFSKKSFTLQFV